MKVTIHDVGHGLCVSLVHENGNVMLWDCGQADWNRPSEVLYADGIRTINNLFITNYDEDHVSDLPQFRQSFSIQLLYRNNTITADQLQALKRQGGPLTTAMESMISMIRTYTGDAPAELPAFPNVAFTTFRNLYLTDFNDTNNISLVTFLQCGATRFIIPGDIETAGWEKLLANASFVNNLASVNVFIASHHGRDNGYCAEVFQHCTPDVIVFSDSTIVHATQEMSATYANHANGIQLDGETRYVLSTRNDSTLTWTI
jgi:beta-lactamase superfamily II metal-dependent hydrolase